MSENEGPGLDELVHHLAQTGDCFLREPRIGTAGLLHVDALVADCLAALGGSRLVGATLDRWRSTSKKQRNRLRQTAVACWLLSHPWFHGRKKLSALATAFLRNGLDETARLVDAEAFVRDPDRREELARICLAALQLRPAGESGPQASDRLKTVSSVERERVIRESKAQQERAKALREAMAAKAAQEAAARYGRE